MFRYSLFIQLLISSCVVPPIIQLLSQKDHHLILTILSVIDNIVSIDNVPNIPIDFTGVSLIKGDDV